jgi:selenocysteine lyase/cysteine desulfurase
MPQPLIFGGTGSESVAQDMPDFLPDRCEGGTLNVPGIAGLSAGMAWLRKEGISRIHRREHTQVRRAVKGLEELGIRYFSGPHQAGTVSFVPEMDCEELAERLGKAGIAVRAGLHCAPLAHESAGTLETGTVRVSFGIDASGVQTDAFLDALSKIPAGRK